MMAPFGDRLILQVPFFQHPADGIGNGQNQTILLENGMFTADAFELFHDRFAFITVLRDPVPRWISEYFFNRYKKSPHNRHDMPIEEFLESDKGRDQGCQYVRFLANPNAQDDLRSASVIDQAKQNLLKVDLVGFVEHQHDFVRQFHERFGRKLNIGHLNKNPKAKQDQQALLTDDIMERITAVCRPDIEIFQFAVENFSSK